MRRRPRILLPALIVLASLAARPARADMTYLALGDSIAFGETNFQEIGPILGGNVVQSAGDRGYVSLLADHLALYNGGVRPNVLNLGVDNETTASVSNSTLNGANPASYLANSNYPNPFTNPTTQAAQLMAAVMAQKAMGNTISYVTISLGANDILPLLNLPLADAAAQLPTALSTLAQNYATFLGEVRSELPNADITLLGYYNPFPGMNGVDAGTVALTTQAILALNNTIHQLADSAGVRYVDVYAPFVGHEADLTYINSQFLGAPNVHPNAAGYALIGQQLAVVPEPASLALLALGLAGLGAFGARRRSA